MEEFGHDVLYYEILKEGMESADLDQLIKGLLITPIYSCSLIIKLNNDHCNSW